MDIKSKISKLPSTSGVYFFKNKNGKIIYIGKANSLNSRVSSYFKKSSNLPLKIKKMVKEINDVQYMSTSSEIEAIILERKMIKKNHPYYNTQLKDDKSFPFIRITLELDFPQILFYRKTKEDNIKNKSIYFGPFVDSEATRNVIKIIRQIFKIRGCKKKKLRKKDICLDYQIELCSAPCAGLIDKKEYRKMVREVCLFLSGRQKKLLRDLYSEMKNLSIQLDFEKAAKVWDKIKSIEEIFKGHKVNFFNNDKKNEYTLIKIDEKEKMEIEKGKQAILDLQEQLNLKKTPEVIEAFDISNIQGELSVGSMIVFNNGRPKKENYRRYKIKTVKHADDYAMLQEVIKRRYTRLLSEHRKMPDLILIDGGKGQLSSALKSLDILDLRGKIAIIGIAKRLEELFYPDDPIPLYLDKKSETLKIIQR
ncbi:MAG: excinuclease ABC subunit UvrC, partial [Candidatus Atribacteria bacterium]|nr:excinuclease ABC subunit UvrC [Candidatus Atribacteria bacterium]